MAGVISSVCIWEHEANWLDIEKARPVQIVELPEIVVEFVTRLPLSYNRFDYL
ncbi:hypothetical protein BBR01nite_00300 [Brevibacillus brevis]|nr:hypothetical protein BBR01nite_00300 [Brevibacillus brevis]